MFQKKNGICSKYSEKDPISIKNCNDSDKIGMNGRSANILDGFNCYINLEIGLKNIKKDIKNTPYKNIISSSFILSQQ